MSKKSLTAKTNEFVDLVSRISKLEKEVKILKKAEEKQDRSSFVDMTVNILIGAAGEFFKCRINDKLDLKMKDLRHWEKEWRYHLGKKLFDQVTRKIKFSDREKAVREALQSHADAITSQVRSASNQMAEYLKKFPIKMNGILDKQDISAYYSEVEMAIDRIFDAQYPVPEQPEPPWNNKPRKKK